MVPVSLGRQENRIGLKCVGVFVRIEVLFQEVFTACPLGTIFLGRLRDENDKILPKVLCQRYKLLKSLVFQPLMLFWDQ